MSKKRQKRKVIKENLLSKRRLVILNEDTFEETFSLKLTLMNVFVVASVGAILIIFVTTFIIAFTPLREFIPGYSSSQLKKEATELALKSDSLSKAIKQNDLYLKAIKKVLTGELEYAKFNKDSILETPEVTADKVDLTPSEAELELRKQVAIEEQKAASNSAAAKRKSSK